MEKEKKLVIEALEKIVNIKMSDKSVNALLKAIDVLKSLK